MAYLGTKPANQVIDSTLIADGTITTSDLANQAVTQDKLSTYIAPKGTPAFSAYQSTSLTVSSNTFTKITINTETFDTNSNFDTSTNRFTPTIAGYYQFNGSAVCQGSTGTNLSDLVVVKNGGSSAGLSGTLLYNAGAVYTTMLCTVSGILYMNGSTDYVELQGRVIGTGTLSVSTGIFSGALVRAA